MLIIMTSLLVQVMYNFHALKKTYTDRDLVQKILRSLTSEWRSKADAIYESIGASNVTNDGLRGNLKTYESTILNPSLNDHRKGIALKFVKEPKMNGSSNDDEVKLVMKKFCKFLWKKEKVEDGHARKEINPALFQVFYSNLRREDVVLYSLVKSTPIELTVEQLGRIAGLPSQGDDVFAYGGEEWENEKIDEMFERFSKIVNDLHALKKTYTDKELVRKILRSLTPEWRSKADAIQESIGVTNVTIDELRGNLKTYESTILFPSLGEQKKKGIALKGSSSQEPAMEESSDEDNEFGLVIKKFHKFMRKEYERKGKKHGGPPKCYGCGEVGHIKPKCPNAKNEKENKPFKKHRAYISWGGDSGDESSEASQYDPSSVCNKEPKVLEGLLHVISTQNVGDKRKTLDEIRLFRERLGSFGSAFAITTSHDSRPEQEGELGYDELEEMLEEIEPRDYMPSDSRVTELDDGNNNDDDQELTILDEVEDLTVG
ncbi:unnamed protein product [Cuscuta campestris]|uniref:CCHC-type domain-containing protein n=1 Tax=Cuscuta campestris TaxID=132261 RepID=A0A484L4W5_9ASTE|nr:unnamed protein product [Cuscuta campestris]